MTKIEWTDETWNPVTGCTKIAAGCKHCYAERMAKRLRGRVGYPADDPFRVTLHPDRLEQPLRWRKPRMVFVCSMGDLFHDDVPKEFIARVGNAMDDAPHHTYQILTKRPERMAKLIRGGVFGHLHIQSPKPYIWLGTSASTQKDLDANVPPLLSTPAAVRFVSLEPLLGPIDVGDHLPCKECGGNGWIEVGDHSRDWCAGSQCHGVDWVIVGGESGPRARPMHPKWVRGIRDLCVKAGVPFFFKQWGEWAPDCIHPDDRWGDHDPCRTTPRPDRPTGVMFRCGKKRAGRKLDGCTWDEMPKVTS